jgi:hypothetical protein
MTSNVETHRSGTLRSRDIFSKRRIVQGKTFRDTSSWYQRSTSWILSKRVAKIVIVLERFTFATQRTPRLQLPSAYQKSKPKSADFWCLSLTTIFRLVSGASSFVRLFYIKKALHLQVCYCSQHRFLKIGIPPVHSSEALSS